MFKSSFTILPLLVAPIHAQYAEDPTVPTPPSAYDTTIAGRPWLPDKGIMLNDMTIDKRVALFETDGRLDNRRTLPYNLKNQGACYTLKFQQEYSTTDETAQPGTFTWVKDAGSDSFFDINAAVRADIWLPDFYNPEGLEASLGFGYQIKKNGEEVDLQSLHVSIPFVPNEYLEWIPFLQKADQVFQADVSYTRDEVADEDGFDFETDWKPVFVFPWENYGTASSAPDNATKGLWVGVRCSTDGMPLDPRKAPDISAAQYPT